MLRAYLNLDTNLINSSYAAADKLIDTAFPPFNPTEPILIATFVNVKDLDDSSAFGKTISEQISARFAQKNYKVIELKLRKNIFVRQNSGELLLSREAMNIGKEHKAQCVVVGTYSVANYLVYVSSSIVRFSDNAIIAKYDYTVPLGANNRNLLNLPIGEWKSNV